MTQDPGKASSILYKTQVKHGQPCSLPLRFLTQPGVSLGRACTRPSQDPGIDIKSDIDMSWGLVDEVRLAVIGQVSL